MGWSISSVNNFTILNHASRLEFVDLAKHRISESEWRYEFHTYFAKDNQLT